MPPYALHWFPDTLLAWEPGEDPDLDWNISHVPLARRSTGPLDPVNANTLRGAGVASLSIFDVTSGHPAQGSWTDSSAYAFTYWPLVDLMVMWGGSAGEGLILAPAPYVTEAGHRNGVPVLGTVFFPPTAYGGDFAWVEDLLVEEGGAFPVADKLIEAARVLGFDGWFINQETAGGSAADAAQMVAFMSYFQEHKDPGMVLFWYDAMTEGGPVAWQNALTSSNDSFFEEDGRVSDAMFLNFWWDSAGLAASAQRALDLERSPFDLYAGVDVQARGYETSVSWDSVFPSEGAHTSLGLYVPSWTWHEAADLEDFHARESRFWAGVNGDPSDTATAAAWKGLAHYVEAQVPELDHLSTTFSAGQGTAFYVEGEVAHAGAWSQLGLQDVQPTWRWLTTGEATAALDFDAAWYGGASLAVEGTGTVFLYETDLEITDATTLRVTWWPEDSDFSPFLVLLTDDDVYGSAELLPLGPSDGGWTTVELDTSGLVGTRVTGLAMTSGTTRYHLGELTLGELGPAPAAPPSVVVEGFSWSVADHARARCRWESSPDPVRHYEVWHVREGGDRVLVGATSGLAWYAEDLVQVGDATVEHLEVLAVGPGLVRGGAAQAPVDWRWGEEPDPPPELGPNLALGGAVTDEHGDSPGAETPAMALDGDARTKWLTFHDAAWLSVDLGQARDLTHYALTTANDAPARDPMDWRLLGSMDGSEWTELDARSGELFTERFEERVYAATPGSWRHLRLEVLANAGGAELQLAELGLFKER